MTSHTKPKPPPTKLRKAKLIERGWTDELVSLYLQPFHLCHGLHLVSDVERIERSAEWKADRAASENMEYISISKTDLKSRGWSLSMIDKLLGPPDSIIQLRQNRVMHKYRMPRVMDAESSEVFQDLKKAAAARSVRGKAVSAKREEAVRAAATKLSEKLHVSPPPTFNALKRLALDARQEWYDDTGQWRSVDGADDATVDRWCRNYLRHTCSNYEDLLEQLEYEFRGQPGVRDLYADIVRPVIDRKVNDAIRSLRDKQKEAS